MAKTADIYHLKKKKKRISVLSKLVISLLLLSSIACITLAFYFHLRTREGFYTGLKSRLATNNTVTTSQHQVQGKRALSADEGDPIDLMTRTALQVTFGDTVNNNSNAIQVNETTQQRTLNSTDHSQVIKRTVLSSNETIERRELTNVY